MFPVKIEGGEAVNNMIILIKDWVLASFCLVLVRRQFSMNFSYSCIVLVFWAKAFTVNLRIFEQGVIPR